MDIALIVLGAALALIGGMSTDLWRAHRAGRAASAAIYLELREQEHVLGGWFMDAQEARGVTDETGRFSASDLRKMGEARLPNFPALPRLAWETHRTEFVSIATPQQFTAAGLWYQFSTASRVQDVSAALLFKMIREATESVGPLMEISVFGRCSRRWRNWREYRHSGQAE